MKELKKANKTLTIASVILLIANTILVITLFYILNLKYYDSYCDSYGCYNYEEKISILVKRIIREQGGLF